MRDHLHSLQFRLIVSFALVLAISLGSVSVYARYIAAKEAERFQEELDMVRAARVQQMANMVYDNSRQLDHLVPVIRQAGTFYGLRITLVGPEGDVVADSTDNSELHALVEAWQFSAGTGSRRWPRSVGPDNPYPGGWPYLDSDPTTLAVSRDSQRVMPVVDSGRTVGSLVFEPASDSFFVMAEPQASQIVSRLDRFLLWTGIAAMTAGLAVVYVTSQRTLSPIRVLRTAAGRLGEGDFSQRVRITGTTEVVQLGQTFNAMAEGLQRASTQRKDMMADIAHELRTPLANIQGYVEALRDGLMEPTPAAIESIYQQVLHLARLMEDLRLLALADAGALPLYREAVPVQRLLRTSVDAFRPRAEAKGVLLSIAAPADVPPVDVDHARVGQVLANLLDNAITHTPAGGSIVVDAEVDDGLVSVSVADTGEGISPNALPYVFERFYRVDPSRARATGGTGLGLSIAKQFVEAHGGTIRVESAPGQGTLFTVRLPLAAPQH